MLSKSFVNLSEELSFTTLESSELLIKEFKGKNIILDYKEFTTNTVFYYEALDSNTNITINLSENSKLDFKIILLNNDCNLSIIVNMNGIYSECYINTLSLAKNAVKNIDVVVKHNAKETISKVNNYGISFEHGKISYDIDGKIESKMTNANVSQITRGLILDQTGYCSVKPVLLIDYYDVKAYHGATIGKISDDDLFYLMSRGLTKNEAYMLIVNGIITPYLLDMDELLKEEIMTKYQSFFKGE